MLVVLCIYLANRRETEEGREWQSSSRLDKTDETPRTLQERASRILL